MQFSKVILQWYDQNKRSFPWRERVFAHADEHAYHTWICEVMSQQTLLDVLLPKYNQFLIKLPNINTLAYCSEDELRELWKGLGYYARARNLQKGALYILNERKGVFPTSQQQWLNIPGVGAYTSAVIASICYKEPIIAIDGNVIRVASRLLNIQEKDIWKPIGTHKIFSFLQPQICKLRPGDMNQALMDLGATVCKKQNPNCAICPVQKNCKAYMLKTVHLCPPIKPRKETIEQDLIVLVLNNTQDNNKVLLSKRNHGFLKNTFGFPLLKQKKFSSVQILQTIDEFGFHAKICQKQFKHSITHHKIKGYVIIVEAKSENANIANLKQYFNIEEDYSWLHVQNIKSQISSSLDQKAYKIFNQESLISWNSKTNTLFV